MTGERWHAPANKVRNLAFVWLFTLALSFILVGCDFEEPKPEPPIPILIITPDPTATPASVIVHLPDSKELRLITIDDSWGGYSRPSALSASYTLTSTTEGLAGEGEFDAKDFDLYATKAVTGVGIPESEVQRFVSLLDGVQAEGLIYDCASIARGLDHYPNLDIELHYNQSTVTFWSCSQDAGFAADAIVEGGDRTPWAVVIEGKTYTIKSDIPARAYAILNPYLKKDQFDSFVLDAIKNK